MKEFAAHLGELRSQHGKLVFMAYPASYDWQWGELVLEEVRGREPFRHVWALSQILCRSDAEEQL